MMEQERQRKITVKLPDDLYRQLRIYVAQTDQDMKDVVEAAVRRYLEQQKERE